MVLGEGRLGADQLGVHITSASTSQSRSSRPVLAHGPRQPSLQVNPALI